MQSFFDHVIQEVFGEELSRPLSIHQVGGGCINQTAYFEFRGQRYFLKWNSQVGDLFEKEAMGLQLLQNSRTIKVPSVLRHGKIGENDYLCLEYIEKAPARREFWISFGRQLAAMHQQSAEHFGLDHDNHIGRLPQSNQPHIEWVDFFIQERLEPQLLMASQNGLINTAIQSQFESLYLQLSDLIPEEKPALLHGDLWSGNMMCTTGNVPSIFDPAIYYGHREAELAFTQMFGGYDRLFYQSYQESFPLQPGHEKRVQIFNLYPLLVHVNLFGPSYLSGIRQTLDYFTRG